MNERSNGGKGAGLAAGLPPGASIEVILRSGDTVVRRFVRVCPEETDQIRRVAGHAAGWLQAWSCQLSDEQWQADARAQRQEAVA